MTWPSKKAVAPSQVFRQGRRRGSRLKIKNFPKRRTNGRIRGARSSRQGLQRVSQSFRGGRASLPNRWLGWLRECSSPSNKRRRARRRSRFPGPVFRTLARLSSQGRKQKIRRGFLQRPSRKPGAMKRNLGPISASSRAAVAAAARGLGAAGTAAIWACGQGGTTLGRGWRRARIHVNARAKVLADLFRESLIMGGRFVGEIFQEMFWALNVQLDLPEFDDPEPNPRASMDLHPRETP